MRRLRAFAPAVCTLVGGGLVWFTEPGTDPVGPYLAGLALGLGIGLQVGQRWTERP